MTETFKIDFNGTAVEKHEMNIGAVAEALFAFKGLAEQTNKIVNGKDIFLDVRVKGGFHAGSFEIELILDYAQQAAAALIPLGIDKCTSVLSSVVNTIQLYRWAKGRDVEILSNDKENNCLLQNVIGEQSEFNQCTINIYINKNVKNCMDRMTSVLDDDGFTDISIGNVGLTEKISKDDRKFIRIEPGTVISDNTVDIELEITGASYNGSPKGWRFSDGGDGLEFSATVEDDDFLNDVRSRKYIIGNGDSIFVTMRTVQRKQTQRTMTERSILIVHRFIPYTD